MRKCISSLLEKLANKINPKERVDSIENVDNYEAKKLGICLVRTKSEIKNYRRKKKTDEGWSNRKSDYMLAKDVMNEVRQSIIRSIDEKGLIEYAFQRKDNELHVSGEIKVYIKKVQHEK